MKQFIVLCASIVLGLALYLLIMGPKDSVKTGMSNLWQSQVEARTAADLVDL